MTSTDRGLITLYVATRKRDEFHHRSSEQRHEREGLKVGGHRNKEWKSERSSLSYKVTVSFTLGAWLQIIRVCRVG